MPQKKTVIPIQAIVSYLEKLVNTPSPTGWTLEAEALLLDNAKKKKIAHKHTRKGGVIYSFTKPNAKPTRMFAAHVDTLGAIVKSVAGNVVKIAFIGNYPAIYVIGETCIVHASNGKQFTGTILPNNPAVHVNKKLGEDKLTADDLHIRLDRKADAKPKLESIVKPGDFVSLNPRFGESEGFIRTRHLDDKASAAILLAVADTVTKNPERYLEYGNLHLFFNVTEETGQGIAAYPQPLDELVIVDMGAIGDGLQGDEYSVSICAKDSSGPYNFHLTKKLTKLSERIKVKYKTDIFPYYGSDGSALLSAGGDVRVGLVGPGVSASHGYERTHRDALENTYRLLLAYLESE